MKSTGVLYKHLVLITGLFLLSVIIRYPNLNRPLSKHHEFCTAVTLQVLKSWEGQGIATVGYNPSMNFSQPSDKFINNWASSTGKIVDKRGNYYYVSHPPFAYYLPYAVFQVLKIKSSVFALQLLNLGLNLISVFLVFGISLMLFREHDSIRPKFAFIAAILYLFSASPLWFQSNVYMSDTLVMVFFLLAVFWVLRHVAHPDSNWLYSVVHGATVFLMVYTSWLGVFYVLALLGLSVTGRLRLNSAKLFITASFLGMFLAIGLMLAQYSQIAGKEALLGQLFNRYEERGSLGLIDSNNFVYQKISELTNVGLNLVTGYLPVLMILLIGLFYKGSTTNLNVHKTYRGLQGLMLWPVLLLHVFLLNYAGHDFVQLYFGIFLAVAGARVIGTLANPFAAVTTLVLLSIGTYYFINRPGNFAQNGERYDTFMQIGKHIAAQANDDEVVLISGIIPEPQLIYYAGRNMIYLQTEQELDRTIDSLKEKNVVYFSVGNDGKINRLMRYQAQ